MSTALCASAAHIGHNYITLIAGLHQVLAMLLLVAVSKSSVQSMKFTRNFNQQLHPSMFSRGYTCGTTQILRHVDSPPFPAQ